MRFENGKAGQTLVPSEHIKTVAVDLQSLATSPNIFITGS